MRSLTGRGRALLLIGALGAAAGWLLGQPAIAAVGVVLILLPLLGALTVHRARFLLGSSRVVTPPRIPFGDEAEVLLTVENGSRLASGTLLLQDAVPPQLGEPARLLLDRIPSGGMRSQRYRVSGGQRGRYRIGPLTVVVTDPFGMATAERAFTSTSPTLVTPRIVPLGDASGGLMSGGGGDTRQRAIAARGEDDLLPREHRAGDDMRRIHWRATARQGDLMVRREEQSWNSTLTVLLDDREAAHHGTGAASTFEWATSAAASVAVHYLRLGWRVTVITTTGRVLADGTSPAGDGLDALLEAFAEARMSTGAMDAHRALLAGASTAVVAVLGRLEAGSERALVRPSTGYAGCLLLEPGPADDLRAGGWHVATWNRSTTVAEAWGHIAPTSLRERTAAAR